jgi:starvation-inducible outer membrane lipoprotein
LFGTLDVVPTYQVLEAKSIAVWSVELRINMPPTFDKYSFLVSNDMYAYHTWNVVVKFENDIEGDSPIQTAEIVKSVSGTPNMADTADWVAVVP